MRTASDDLERRRPVWEALSAVFLDNEIDDAWRARIVGTLRSSGYSDAELEQILWSELCPVLYANLNSIAGEWSGFDMDDIERAILTRPAGRMRRWWSYVNGGYLARRDWRRIREVMRESRRQREAGSL